MSKASHLITRNRRYYFFIRIPTDLLQFFSSTFIKKSLKTHDRTAAKEEALTLEYNVSRVFRLIRSGLLSDHQVMCMVSELLPKRKGRKSAGVRLSEVMEAYVKEHDKKWGQKTRLENIGSCKLITDIVGDMEVRAINKQTILDLRDKLGRLPANIYKMYPNKSVKQVLNISGITPMSTTTVNKHIFRFSSILKYAVNEGQIQINYAEKMKISIKRRPDEERKAYSRKDLQSIVDNLPRIKDKPERLWIPMIAMYSGMRLDEICQLYVEDIQQLDGVWCINVNDEIDKKVKTLSGKRVIPVHPVLLSIGIIEYVEETKECRCPRLWMNLNRRQADGYSNAFGKWFQRFNREHVTKDLQKTFHSFRHTVADTLKQAGLQEVVIAEIMGHSNSGSMTMGRYGKRYQPRVLLEAVKKLDYGISMQMIMDENLIELSIG
ncbi:MAG: site-specific integrase [Desulfuromonadales bacterium]|nr:site-specific integrase [Desulfuromonadales bacterium]